MTVDFGQGPLALGRRCRCSLDILADLMRYRFSLATRRFAVFVDGEGDVFLLAAADMVFVSLLPRSIDRCRNDEWVLDLVRMITIVPARPAADDVLDTEGLAWGRDSGGE